MLVIRDLPYGVDGLVSRQGDDYCIVINARLNTERQRAAYLHEVSHIRHNDLLTDVNVNEIERYR